MEKKEKIIINFLIFYKFLKIVSKLRSWNFSNSSSIDKPLKIEVFATKSWCVTPSGDENLNRIKGFLSFKRKKSSYLARSNRVQKFLLGVFS